MSTTPAARLARLKVQHPTWTITRTEGGYLAVDYGWGQRVEVATLGLLEYELDHLGEPACLARPSGLSVPGGGLS